MKRVCKHILTLLALALAACRADTTDPRVEASLLGADDPERFSDWSAPELLGPSVNSDLEELGPFISRDGLSLYFGSFRTGGLGGPQDMWVSRRACETCDWETPVNLGAPVNSAANDGQPALSPDGHQLFFTSNRPGGLGANDLYVARRRSTRDDFGWQDAVNLGSGVNTAFGEAASSVFEDDATGTITLYFGSNRPLPGEECGTPGLPACDSDIYASALLPEGTFGPAVLVSELNSPFGDAGPEIGRNGLELFLVSDRPGSLGGDDLWVATRASTADRWSAPTHLGPVVNSAFSDGGPGLSFDGTALYFHSPFRPGGLSSRFELLITTRRKLK